MDGKNNCDVYDMYCTGVCWGSGTTAMMMCMIYITLEMMMMCMMCIALVFVGDPVQM